MRFYIILFFVFIISFILAKYVIKYFLSLSTNPGKISGINHGKDTSTKGLDFFAKGKPSQDNISNPYLPKEPWKKGLNSETPHESDKMRQTMEAVKENRYLKEVEKMIEDLNKDKYINKLDWENRYLKDLEKKLEAPKENRYLKEVEKIIEDLNKDKYINKLDWEYRNLNSYNSLYKDKYINKIDLKVDLKDLKDLKVDLKDLKVDLKDLKVDLKDLKKIDLEKGNLKYSEKILENLKIFDKWDVKKEIYSELENISYISKIDLYVLDEIVFFGYKIVYLDLFFAISILFGVLIIISKNPIVSVLYLIGLFLTLSSYLIFIGLNFIGLAYLLVYIGAISILFLFILMLINVRVSELLIDSINGIASGLIVGNLFIYFIYNLLPYMYGTYNDFLYNFSILKNLAFVSSMVWDWYVAELSHIISIGNILYGNYAIWLVITSIILLLAMVGAIIITIKQKK